MKKYIFILACGTAYMLAGNTAQGQVMTGGDPKSTGTSVVPAQVKASGDALISNVTLTNMETGATTTLSSSSGPVELRDENGAMRMAPSSDAKYVATKVSATSTEVEDNVTPKE